MRTTHSDHALPAGRPAHGFERGAALIVVLMFAALLSGLAAVALQGATSGARAATVFLDAMRADELGRAAGDALAFEIMHGGPGAARGGAFAIHLAQAEIAVEYLSESARVDLNNAPVDLIVAVLAAAGAEPEAIGVARTRILADRAPTPAAPPPPATDAFGRPVAQQAAFAPPPQPVALIESPAEAVARWGLPAAVAARALPAFTVASGAGTVDPMLADRLVLAALLGDEARVDDYIARRGQGFVDTGSAVALLPVPAQAFAGFADVSAVRAQVRVTVAHRFKRAYEIVLDPPSFAGQAPNVLSWHPLF